MKNLFFTKKIIFFLLIFNGNNIISTTIVSIGGDCTVAGVLRKFSLRKAAYPFDWMYSIFIGVYKAFEDDFVNFLNEDSLKVSDDKKMIIDYYGLEFVHDFPTILHPPALKEKDSHEWAEIRSDWRNFIPQIKAKYIKRINRLKKLLGSNEYVILIRYGIEPMQAIMLRNLLIKKYPKLNFQLVAVNAQQKELPNANLYRIKFFTIAAEGLAFWKDWENIFKSLEVIPDDINGSNPSTSTPPTLFQSIGWQGNGKLHESGCRQSFHPYGDEIENDDHQVNSPKRLEGRI